MDNLCIRIIFLTDFMGVRVVRRLFRRSGAFFMRRSFMSDELYWVIFQEYVQNQLQKGDKPLEFFLEGTRSRTGKFLHPKLGTFWVLFSIFLVNLKSAFEKWGAGTLVLLRCCILHLYFLERRLKRG